MTREKTEEILSSIIECVFGVTFANDAPLASQFNIVRWEYELSHAIQKEIGIEISYEEVRSAKSLSDLCRMIEPVLSRSSNRRSIIDIYVTLEQLAREELHANIQYHWRARWVDFSAIGNWLTAPEGLDYVELVMRIEREFGFGIPDEDAQAMQTVGESVSYLCRRSLAQRFTLRRRPESVCQSAFVFHELRRLLMVRGGVRRRTVRLNARLCDLLPSWHSQFWQQVQDIFQVDLPRGFLIPLGLGFDKRTTVSELVRLIVSARVKRQQ